MAYDKNIWVDQKVERPKTYQMIQNNIDGSVTLVDDFGLVSELGTPVNADNMNHIEEGIASCDLRKHNLTEVYEKDEWVTGVIGGEKDIYQSLVSGNYGNPITDTTKWKKVELGGSQWASSLNTKVSKTGDTMTGSLDIQASNPSVILTNTNAAGSYFGVQMKAQNFDYTDVTAPTTNQNLGRIIFNDKNNQGTGYFYQQFTTDNNLIMDIRNRRSINGSFADAFLRLFVNATGKGWVTAPASAEIGSILTTTGINKSTNGYVKLGNGLILQWGRNTEEASNNSYNKTVTLPIAFTTTNYSILVTDIMGYGTVTAMASIVSTSQFNKSYVGYSSNSIKGFYWIAIGY